jgi:L-2,4-diaminobutyrate decarboxylase
MALAERLADLVDAAPELELWQRPVTGVVNWRPRAATVEDVRAELQDAWISTATLAGETWFRSVPANPHADPTHAVHAVQQALTRR